MPVVPAPTAVSRPTRARQPQERAHTRWKEPVGRNKSLTQPTSIELMGGVWVCTEECRIEVSVNCGGDYETIDCHAVNN